MQLPTAWIGTINRGEAPSPLLSMLNDVDRHSHVNHVTHNGGRVDWKHLLNNNVSRQLRGSILAVFLSMLYTTDSESFWCWANLLWHDEVGQEAVSRRQPTGPSESLPATWTKIAELRVCFDVRSWTIRCKLEETEPVPTASLSSRKISRNCKNLDGAVVSTCCNFNTVIARHLWVFNAYAHLHVCLRRSWAGNCLCRSHCGACIIWIVYKWWKALKSAIVQWPAPLM